MKLLSRAARAEMDDNHPVSYLMEQLEDVGAGGATAFTHAGVTVWPKKGKSIFWWNLRSDLSGDTLTRHGGCPVLHGSKWSMSLWFCISLSLVGFQPVLFWLSWFSWLASLQQVVPQRWAILQTSLWQEIPNSDYLSWKNTTSLNEILVFPSSNQYNLAVSG